MEGSRTAHNRTIAEPRHAGVATKTAERRHRGLVFFGGRTGRATTALFVLTALFLSHAAAARPRAYAEGGRSRSPFGMAAHLLWQDHSRQDVDGELNAMAAAGVHNVRVDVGWQSMEEVKGHLSEWHAAQLDYVISGCRMRQIEPELLITSTPRWANRGAGQYVPPDNYTDFNSFMYRMVARYKGRIRYWEIWNEPDQAYFWRPTPNAADFTRLLKEGYAGAKAADPNAVIISGGLASNNTDYLRKMYAAGARRYFDLLGLHPYNCGDSPYYPYHAYNSQWHFVGIRDMREVMDANGDQAKHIWASETGWQTSTGGRWPVTEAQQARYTGELYQRLFEEFPYVDVVCIYNSRNRGTNPAAPLENFGLMRYNYAPKPAYYAFANAAMRLWPQPTTSVARAWVTYPQSETIDGRIPPEWGETTATVQRRVAGMTIWTNVRTARVAGTLRTTTIPRAGAWYRLYVPSRRQVSAPVLVRVRPAISMSVSRTTVSPLVTVRLSGQLAPVSGGTIVLQRRYTAEWFNLRNLTTDASWRFATSLRFYKRGRFYVRVKYWATSAYLGTQTPATAIDVR